jgi:hypothetical protein
MPYKDFSCRVLGSVIFKLKNTLTSISMSLKVPCDIDIFSSSNLQNIDNNPYQRRLVQKTHNSASHANYFR